MMWAVILDFLVLILLGAALFYAVLLNRRLTVLRNSRQELQKFMDHFTVSLEKAEDSIKTLKKTGQIVVESVEGPFSKLKTLQEDLLFLLDKGEQLAQRLETNVRTVSTLPREEKQGQTVSILSASNDMSPVSSSNTSDLFSHLKNIR